MPAVDSDVNTTGKGNQQQFVQSQMKKFFRSFVRCSHVTGSKMCVGNYNHMFTIVVATAH